MKLLTVAADVLGGAEQARLCHKQRAALLHPHWTRCQGFAIVPVRGIQWADSITGAHHVKGLVFKEVLHLVDACCFGKDAPSMLYPIAAVAGLKC